MKAASPGNINRQSLLLFPDVQAPARTFLCFPGSCSKSKAEKEEERWSGPWQDSSATGRGREGAWLGKPSPRSAAYPAEIIGQNWLGEAACLSSPPALVAAAAAEDFALRSNGEAREAVWLFLLHSQILPPAEGQLSQRRELCRNLRSSKSQPPREMVSASSVVSKPAC